MACKQAARQWWVIRCVGCVHAHVLVDLCDCMRVPVEGMRGDSLILASVEVQPTPDGTIVLRHASIIHRDPEKVVECVCLLNN